MEVLNKPVLTQVGAGNLLIPALCSLGIGVSGGLLSWAIKTSYDGSTEKFGSIQNYILEGSIGAGIAALATAGFVMAA